MASDPDRNAEMGIAETRVYRMVAGSGVIVAHKVDNVEDAQQYKNIMESAEAKVMLEQMGAKLPLTIWLAEEV